jgi:signal transduction histidine kinase
MKLPPFLVTILKIIALALVYRLAVIVGLSMAYAQSNSSPVWPPSGIALAALLLFGIRLWPGIAISVFLGSVLTDAPLPLAAGMAIGNTLEAVIGAYLLRRLVGIHLSLDRIRDVIGLILVAIFASAISATFGTGSVMLISNGADFGPIWLTWWIGNFLGSLVVAPFLLVWISNPPRNARWKRAIEFLAVFVIITLVTWYVFFTSDTAWIAHQALLYVIFPFTIWASLRAGQRGATLAILLVSWIAILGTIEGFGPFAVPSKNDSLILLQTFMSVVSLTSLILAAATNERQAAVFALQQRIRDLAALNKSSETFLGALGESDLLHTICRLAVERLGVDAAWIEMVNWEIRQTESVAVYGIPPEQIGAMQGRWDDRTRIPISNSVLVARSPSNSNAEPYHSFAIFPLYYNDTPLGTLKTLSKKPDFFDADQQVLLQSFANLAVIAIQNSWLLERISKGNEQLHALSARLMKAQEVERLNLSRELHDESGQLVAGMMVQLGLLDRIPDLPNHARPHITELKNISNAIQTNLHALAVNLRPASLDHLGLVSALQQYLKEFTRQYCLAVDFEATGMEEKRLPNEVETAIFRIVQESLTNVVLHAQASHVDVLLNRHNGNVVAVIEDDGVGFSISSLTIENQLGLFGMRERVEMLGGTLTLESTPGSGTMVKVEVPYHG